MKPIRHLCVVSAGALLLGACDIPTEAPILEQNWVLPIEGISFGVTELLPAGVDTALGSFDVSVDPVATNETLGSLCASCIDSPVPIPVPTFNSSFNVGQPLPTDVFSVSVTSGAIDISVTNGFSFDPLEDGGSGPGVVTVNLTDGPGGTNVGSVVWDGGAGDTMTPGSTSTKTLVIAAGSIGSSLDVVTNVNVPGGQVAPTMDVTDLLDVGANPTQLLVGSVTVGITSKTVNFPAEDLDTEGIDTDITEKIVSGGIELEVGNPFGITLTGTLSLGPPGNAVSKAFNVSGTATSEIDLTYTGDELRQFLGVPGVQFSGSASANAAGGVTINPTQSLSLTPTVSFTLCVGGDVVGGVCGG